MLAIKPQMDYGGSSGWKGNNENNKDATSPLLPLARLMKRLSWIGCPLTFSEDTKSTDGAIQFSVVRRPHLKFAAFAAVPYFLFFVVSVIFSFFDVSLWKFVYELQTCGFAPMDIIAMYVIFVPLAVVSVLHYLAIKKACKTLSIFSLEISCLKGITISSRETKEQYNIISRRQYALIAITIFSAFLYAYMAIAIQIEDWNFYSFVFAFLIFGIVTTLCYVPPMLHLPYSIQQHCLAVVELALKKCADKFNDEMEVVTSAKIVAEEVIHELVDTSIHLSRIVDSAGEALGMGLCIEIIVDAFSGTFGFYFGTIIVTAFTGGEFNKMLFIGGLDFLIVGIIMTARLVTLLSRGQGISNQVNRIKVLLRNVILYQDPSAQDSKRIIHLLDKWSMGGAPVRPCDLFDLNKSTGMSIAGVLLTYVVVLLQFKHGD